MGGTTPVELLGGGLLFRITMGMTIGALCGCCAGGGFDCMGTLATGIGMGDAAGGSGGGSLFMGSSGSGGPACGGTGALSAAEGCLGFALLYFSL